MAEPPAAQNARVYWELFGGVGVHSGYELMYVRWVDITMDIGGYYAHEYPYYQVSVYGRWELDGENKELIDRFDIDAPGGTDYWQEKRILKELSEQWIRCIVVKVERKEGSFSAPTASPPEKGYNDQYDTADPPPWGIRIKETHIYATLLERDVRPDLVIEHMLDQPGFTYSGPEATWMPSQLDFNTVPNDRQSAIDEVNGMLGWNYHCWDGTEFVFSEPASGTAWEIAADDPRTTWSITENVDEVYSAVRVCYGNKRGKPREVYAYGDESVLGFRRSDVITAPDSIKGEAAAVRFGERYLRSHEKKQIAGTLKIEGDDGVCDALLIRPGDTITMTGDAKFLSGTYEVTQVTLNPLDWSAQVQFGTNSKRFDIWLARLAAGAKSIKRR